jgi:hypothetical protein
MSVVLIERFFRIQKKLKELFSKHLIIFYLYICTDKCIQPNK